MSSGIRTTIGEFCEADFRGLLGDLISSKAGQGFASTYSKQVDAWEEELRQLEAFKRAILAALPRSAAWTLILEYPIPRRNKHPDVVLIAEDLIFVIEFKIGSASFDASARWQAEDYALDLRDFHLASANRTIVPVLVATSAPDHEARLPRADPALPIWPVVRATTGRLAEFIANVFDQGHDAGKAPVDSEAWIDSPYRPSMTIIEAARTLFAGHDVRAISHAYADNLVATTDALIRTIQRAQSQHLRTICFVTGVPGAGKTLTGLNASHSRDVQLHGDRPGVFLSGNGPLLKIVREALIRDAVKSRNWSREHAKREVNAFVQNVHSFLAEYGDRKRNETPSERVVVFDEAQRAWDAKQAAKKRGELQSEASLTLSIMERHLDWCVVVALVGGGQEIHTGEAGLEEWGRALANTSTKWNVVASPQVLDGGEGVSGHRLFDGPIPSNCIVIEDHSLHLNVSVRSPRAQQIARWVDGVLAADAAGASLSIADAKSFPIALTRELDVARRWLVDHARTDRRCGLVASSGALRHRAFGLELSSGFRKAYPFEEWFLAGMEDVRSSMRLEVAATEFECQGLELDWVGVCWGDDLCFDAVRGDWQARQLRGSKWQEIKQPEKRRYLLNKYRVLLTRAREGMVIWIPNGDVNDPTRDPERLDRTFTFLTESGAKLL